MKQRIMLTLLSAIVLTSVVGCGGSSTPKPLDADERQAFLEHLEEVRQMENADLEPAQR